MSRLQGVATRYGNPRELRAKILKDPNFLAKTDRPKNDAYSATVWTLEQAHQDAFRLASTLRSIPLASVGRPASEVVTGIKSLFFDSDQIADRMQQTAVLLDALLSEFNTISHELADAQGAMQSFTAASSKTQKALNDEIGSLKAKNRRTRKAAGRSLFEVAGVHDLRLCRAGSDRHCRRRRDGGVGGSDWGWQLRCRQRRDDRGGRPCRSRPCDRSGTGAQRLRRTCRAF